jgi:hypothetical protein
MLVGLLGLLLAGCSGEHAATDIAPAAVTTTSAQPPAATGGTLAVPVLPTPCPGWPKRVANLNDQSMSARTTRTEQPTVDDLAPLIDCTVATGGELLVGTIRDQNAHLARFLSSPPPTAPPPPALTGNAITDYDLSAAYAKELDVYRRTYTAWRQRTDAAVERFRTTVTTLLEKPADAPSTALVDAVGRAYLALTEPTPYPWLARAERVLVVVSDGDETATSLAVPMPPQPVTIYVVR